ncbi:glycosyltransferase family protein [Paenibacillus chibensis]|uniref:Glycosyltransferase family protein n=1 Tax=Paenibacillus chibensis TaxID=59846 RepID=A0ABU6PU66_9BACL|nr:glycosyltransferase family protein [Paenibacillus chibensis]
MKIVAIVQARMGSTRLPGKVLKRLGDRSVLGQVITRLKEVPSIDEIVIATTVNSDDDVLIEEAEKYGVYTFRGSKENVLSRYYYAALERSADTVVRVTSDCPLIDPSITENTIQLFKKSAVDYVSNKMITTFPRGLDTEVFKFEALKDAFEHAYNDIHTEHVTPYIYLHPQQFSLLDYTWPIDYSKYRWTLDTAEDYELITQIYNELDRADGAFSWLEGIELMESRPEMVLINQHIHQKELGE